MASAQLRAPIDPDQTQQVPRVTRKKDKGPRALGVLEITANGKARLIPITILVGDKWYDAGLYMASPRPMSLEPQTVYEGFLSGESRGLFTVTGAQEINDNWYGLGIWKPKGAELAKKAKAKADKPKKPASDDDERPILRRQSSPTAKPTAPQTPPPVNTQTSTAGSSSPDNNPAADNKPATDTKATAEAKPAPKPQMQESDEAPNRPILRRGTPGVEQASSIPMPESTPKDFPADGAGQKNASGAPAASPLAIVATIPAISDAGGPEPRPYVFYVSQGEREDYTENMTKLASEALQKFVATRFHGATAPSVTAENSRLDIYDVNTSNNAVLVLTAKVPANTAPATSVAKAGHPVAKRTSQTTPRKTEPVPPIPGGLEYYVTVVGRVDVNGDVRKLFQSVTDSTRLDAYPRMDIIDAVDANGDGVGELLFRETYDRSHAYAVYRVGMDQLWQLFEGAQR